MYPLEAGSMRFVLISNSNDESSFFSMHTPHNDLLPATPYVVRVNLHSSVYSW